MGQPLRKSGQKSRQFTGASGGDTGNGGVAGGTTVYLVTHGLTQWNADGRVQGHTDTPLNHTGRHMARRLADRLAGAELTALHASDLRRAWETARPLSRRTGLPVIQDPRLREGRWVDQERESEYPVLPFPVEIEGVSDVRRRMVAAMTEIARKHAGGRVLVVSHGGAVRLFMGYVLGPGMAGEGRYRGVRTALNTLFHRNGGWRCLALDDDAHLDGIDPRAATRDHG